MIWIQFGNHHYNMAEIQCVHEATDGRSITVMLHGHTVHNVHVYGRNLTVKQWEHFIKMQKVCTLKACYTTHESEENK